MHYLKQMKNLGGHVSGQLSHNGALAVRGGFPHYSSLTKLEAGESVEGLPTGQLRWEAAPINQHQGPPGKAKKMSWDAESGGSGGALPQAAHV